MAKKSTKNWNALPVGMLIFATAIAAVILFFRPQLGSLSLANASLLLTNPLPSQDIFYSVGNKKVATLTFDDGPTPVYTDEVLNVLQTYGVKGIFFVIGQNVAQYPDITRRIVADGEKLGNHSYTHPDLAKTSADAVDTEIQQTQAIVRTTTHFPMILFRPPFGSLSATVKKKVKKYGLRTVMWDVDSRDWTQPGVDAITANVLSAVRPGKAIILFHVLNQQTVDALPAIITGLRTMGYTFTTNPPYDAYNN